MTVFTRRGIMAAFASLSAGAGATIAAPAIAKPALSPDERIDAALDEIVAAFREKWPNCPIRINDCDNIDTGMILIIAHCGEDEAGSIHHDRSGLARQTGGARNG